MVDVSELGRAVANALVEHPWQKAIEVSTSGMTGVDVAGLVDSVAKGCNGAGVQLRAIIVDPALLPLPNDAPFGNAFYRHGQLIIVDIHLNDAIVVHRA